MRTRQRKRDAAGSSRPTRTPAMVRCQARVFARVRMTAFCQADAARAVVVRGTVQTCAGTRFVDSSCSERATPATEELVLSVKFQDYYSVLGVARDAEHG